MKKLENSPKTKEALINEIVEHSKNSGKISTGDIIEIMGEISLFFYYYKFWHNKKYYLIGLKCSILL